MKNHGTRTSNIVNGLGTLKNAGGKGARKTLADKWSPLKQEINRGIKLGEYNQAQLAEEFGLSFTRLDSFLQSLTPSRATQEKISSILTKGVGAEFVAPPKEPIKSKLPPVINKVKKLKVSVKHSSDGKTFADHLSLYMAKRALTSRDVEEVCGLGKTTVFKLQQGKREPTNRTVQLLRNGFGIDVSKWLPEWEWADDE